jgi:hypothetical protein
MVAGRRESAAEEALYHARLTKKFFAFCRERFCWPGEYSRSIKTDISRNLGRPDAAHY